MVWSGAYQSNKKEVGTLSTLRIPEGSKCLTHASNKAKALNHHRNERLVRAEFESYFEEGGMSPMRMGRSSRVGGRSS